MYRNITQFVMYVNHKQCLGHLWPVARWASMLKISAKRLLILCNRITIFSVQFCLWFSSTVFHMIYCCWGILVVLVPKEVLLTNFMSTVKGCYVVPKAMWWLYLFLVYEAQLMIRLIDGSWIKLTVVDVFTLYAYVPSHVSLQITLLHVYPSKYKLW